jgi:hypothetical protein
MRVMTVTAETVRAEAGAKLTGAYDRGRLRACSSSTASLE